MQIKWPEKSSILEGICLTRRSSYDSYNILIKNDDIIFNYFNETCMNELVTSSLLN